MVTTRAKPEQGKAAELSRSAGANLKWTVECHRVGLRNGFVRIMHGDTPVATMNADDAQHYALAEWMVERLNRG